jgi:hypothetical protein
VVIFKKSLFPIKNMCPDTKNGSPGGGTLINFSFKRGVNALKRRFKEKSPLCEQSAQFTAKALEKDPTLTDPANRAALLAASYAILNEREKIMEMNRDEFRLLTEKFKEEFQKEDPLCPKMAEAIVIMLENGSNEDIDLKTKVLCFLLTDMSEGIEKLGGEALPILLDMQTSEEFDIGKRATGLLLEGLKNTGPQPIAEKLDELREMRNSMKTDEELEIERLIVMLGGVDNDCSDAVRDLAVKATESSEVLSTLINEFSGTETGVVRTRLVEVFKELAFLMQRKGDKEGLDRIGAVLEKALTVQEKDNAEEECREDDQKEIERSKTIPSLQSIKRVSSTGIASDSYPVSEKIGRECAETSASTADGLHGLRREIKAILFALAEGSDTDKQIDKLVKKCMDTRNGPDAIEILIEEFKTAHKIRLWFQPKLVSLIKEYKRATLIPKDAAGQLMKEAMNHEDKGIRALGKRVAEKAYDTSSEILYALDYGGIICYHIAALLKPYSRKAGP